jgi:hypothetical protein
LFIVINAAEEPLMAEIQETLPHDSPIAAFLSYRHFVAEKVRLG